MIQKTTIMRGLSAALIASPGLQAAEVAGVKVDERIRVGSNELVLNGAGLRSKLFVKVYVGALYVGQKASTTAAIIEQNGPRRILMRLLRDRMPTPCTAHSTKACATTWALPNSPT